MITLLIDVGVKPMWCEAGLLWCPGGGGWGLGTAEWTEAEPCASCPAPARTSGKGAGTGGRIVSRSQVQGLQVPGTWEELILIHQSGCTISFWPSSGYNKVLGPGILMTVNMRGMSSEDLVAYVCHG